MDPELHLLREMETDKEYRLEPRLVSVLCMLAENVGRLTPRELLISKIWNDYGGAEDSLNQAISFLRKMLHDSKKELIETVPKKGYILHATISNDENVEPTISKPPRLNRYVVVAAALFGVLAVSFLFYYINERNKIESPQSNAQYPKESLDVDFSELNKPAEVNSSNTITTTAPDGTRYRVVAIGDKRPELYINDTLIFGPQLEKYSRLVDQMLRELWNRQK